MWVADMDFVPAVDVAQNALKHGVYGYFGDDSNYQLALVEWMERRHIGK